MLQITPIEITVERAFFESFCNESDNEDNRPTVYKPTVLVLLEVSGVIHTPKAICLAKEDGYHVGCINGSLKMDSDLDPKVFDTKKPDPPDPDTCCPLNKEGLVI